MKTEDATSTESEAAVIITRPSGQSLELERMVREAGLEVICIPALEIRPVIREARVREILKALERGDFAGMIFSSSNAVRCFYDLQQIYGSGPALPDLRVAVTGLKTAGLFSSLYAREPFLPPDHSASSLLSSFIKDFSPRQKLLYVAGKLTTEILEEGLDAAGISFEKLVVYENVPAKVEPEILSHLKKKDPGSLIFTFYSPSAFSNTRAVLCDCEEILSGSRILSIGGTTSKAIVRGGFEVTAEAQEQSDEGVFKVLLNLLEG